MKALISQISTILFLFQANFAFAVSEIRNGGHVIACDNDDGSTSFEMVDLYEARILDLTLVNVDDYFPPQTNALKLIDKLKAVDPVLHAILEAKINNFFTFTSIINNFRPAFVDDSFLIGTPPFCSIRQFAVQRHNALGMSVVIDGDLWDQIEPTQQAALILHEVIYEQFIDAGEENSVNTRLFLRQILAYHSPVMSNPEEYKKFLTRLNPKLVGNYPPLDFNADSHPTN